MSKMFSDVRQVIKRWDLKMGFVVEHDVIEVRQPGMTHKIHYNWQDGNMVYFMEVQGEGWSGSTWLDPMNKFDVARCDAIAELLVAFC